MTSSDATRAASPFWRTVLVAWAALAIIGATWSLATPIGGFPDEPAHLIKAAAVARGELTGKAVADGTSVTVPEYISYATVESCFAFHANTTPNCAAPESGSPTRLVHATTSAGLYNPLYYALVGWPSRILVGSPAIYAMRLVSDLIAAFFLGIAFGLIAGWRRRTLPLLGFLAAATPMVFFLDGSVNPNSVEITATLATFVGVLTVVREPSAADLKRRVTLIAVAAAVAANMRGLSLLWVAIAILAPLVLLGGSSLLELLRVRAVRIAIAVTAVTFVLAGIWLLSSDSLGVGATGAPTASVPGVGTSHLAGFAWNLGSTFFYGQQVIGVFGWLDTAAPASVYFLWSLLVGVLVLLGFALLRRRSLALVAILVGALVFLPPILQGIYITSGGIIWQGRYILPVFVCAMVGLAAVLSDVIEMPQAVLRRLVPMVALAWAAAQFLAFATTLKRYAVGAKSGWPAILHPLWSPPGGVDVLFAVSLVALLATAIALVWFHRRAVIAPHQPTGQ